ncbi:MAG: hypothetical protein ACP5IO_05735 [Elusimicrobiales bacterium]
MKLWILSDYNSKKYYFYKRFSDLLRSSKNINIEIDIKSKENLWMSIFYFFENPTLKLADVIEIPHQWTTLVSKLGVALPLLSVMDEDITNRLYPFMKKTMICEATDKLFSLPVWFEILVMFYRKDMIKPFASSSEMKDLKWNDIFILCDKLKKRYRQKYYFPFENPNIEGYIGSDEMLGCVMNRSSGYFSSDMTMINLHRDEVLVSVLDFLSLAQKKYYPLFEENFFEIGFIRRGLSSMLFSFRRDIKDDGMICVRFPDIMRAKEIARASSFFFFSGSNNLDEIKAFVSEFYTPSNLLELAKIVGAFSPFKNSHLELIGDKESSFYDELFEKIEFIPNIYIYPTFERMMNEFLREQAENIVNSRYKVDDVKKRLGEIKVLCEYLMSSY